MGCFDVTCALTRLPITPGDWAVAAVARPALSRLSVLHAHDELFHHLTFPDTFLTIVKGPYGDYGRLDGADLPDEHWDNSLFFRQDAWDAAVAYARRYDAAQGWPRPAGGASDPDARLRRRIAQSEVPFAEELWHVYRAANRARVHLAAAAGFRMQQHAVAFLQELARIVLAAPIGHDDLGFQWRDPT